MRRKTSGLLDLRYELEKQSGFGEVRKADVNDNDRTAKLRVLGAFRILLPRSTWNRAGQPTYFEKVCEFLRVYGVDVAAVDGATAPIRNIRLAPFGSTDVKALES